jgi:hypothetical protein
MSRFIQSTFFLLILTIPALGQEPEVQDPEVIDQDTTGQRIPLWEGDTLKGIRGSDTVIVYQPSDRVQARPDTLNARTDSLQVMIDSLQGSAPDFSHSPTRATMLSLAFPGLGQAYNKKYWKIPIVWAAFGGAGYAISYNSRNYQLASEEFAQLQDDTNERILQFWRRNLELSYIALLAVYALQIIDAYVDAQLYSWDVNENLSIRVAPQVDPLLVPTSHPACVYSLGCSFQLKR